MPLMSLILQPTPVTTEAATAVPSTVVWGALFLLVLVFAGVVWAGRR